MMKFSDLAISPEILSALTELGFAAPTPIQTETLPLLLEGDTDFLGLAATGTGKTAAFGIPLLERIDRDLSGVQALILCPTRELAIQVAGQIDLIGKHLGVKSLPIYGGTGYGDQIYGLKSGATIVVGTPGRVVDHLNKGTLNLKNLKTLVLDEADEMISMGFKEDLEAVLDSAPKGQTNIWLFSATMGAEVKDVADSYLKNPKKVQINKTEMLSATVEQIYYKTHEYDKPDLVCRLIDIADDFYGIIFCQTKALVAELQQYLANKGYRADCLHGDLDQTARDRVMKAFREHQISILIATDVACRGLDVKDITHVINYSIPRELDNYVHRIGRTARSGKQGIAISLVTYSHRELIGRIERMTKSRFSEGTIPSMRDIALKRLNKVRNSFETNGPQGRALSLLTDEWKATLKEMNTEDVASRFLALMLPDLFADKKGEEKGAEKAEKMQDSRSDSVAKTREGRGGAQREDRGSRDRGPRTGGGREFRGRRDDRGSRDSRGSRDGGGEKRRERSDSRSRFSEKRSFQPRERSAAPRWKKDRAPGTAPNERRESFAAPARREDRKFSFSAEKASKPKWKSDFKKPASSEKKSSEPQKFLSPGTQSISEPKRFASTMGGDSKIKKKKPFGHWKPKE
jgi:ATP-dependent RNA helicase DeaD